MARRKVNKSEKIREAIEKLGGQEASPKTVVEELAKNGLKVATGLVSNIKDAMKGGKTGRKNGKKRGRKPVINGQMISLTDLVAAKKLVETLGSVEAAQSALAALVKLQ